MRGAVLMTAAGSGAATIAIALLPDLHDGYRSPGLRAGLATAGSLIALLTAFLVAGRLRRRALLNELVLACALVVLALAGLGFETLPALAAAFPSDLAMRAWLADDALGAVLFAAAAFVPPRRLRRAYVLPAAVGSVAAAGLLTAVIVFMLPGQLRSALATLQLVLAGFAGLAAAGFLHRARRSGDEFFGWLAMAATLAAVSRIAYFLYPVLDSEQAFAGEVFRSCFYALLLAGCLREILSYWRALAGAAVGDERRRIACELHDGLAQELAFLARNLSALSGRVDGETLERLRRSVDRARLESRRAIHALSDTRRHGLREALADAVTAAAERFHVEVQIDPMPEIGLTAARAEALVRIACEAVTNAARHSGAGRVRLSLEDAGRHVRLRVSDAGCGFDVAAGGAGFGLTAMRERARAVGGEVRISSAPGRGSEVEAAL